MITFTNIDLEKKEPIRRGKSIYILDNEEYFAEEVAIKFYEDLGYHAIWAENDYWWEIMALLFWEIIFARIPGAVTEIYNGIEIEVDPNDKTFDQKYNFMLEISGMPNDFFTPEFYQRRKNLIDNRIMELKNGDLEKTISESFKRNYGKTCRPIERWDKFSLEQLLIPINKISNELCLKILERLLYNFSYNRSGLPDLIVYNGNELFFSEVKSDNDRVSEKQREWHSFLSDELKLRVELFLINHSDNKIKRLKSSYENASKIVKVSFGFSTSKNREKAIEFIKDQDSFAKKGKGKDQVFSAKFSIGDIDNIYKILDLTSRWKSQKIEIGKEIISSTELRNSLWCYRQKTENGASLDYCRQNEYDKTHNTFGCKQIYFNEVENNQWLISDDEFGYVDTNAGEWIFNKDKILETVEEQLNRLKYCPLFNERKIRNLIKKIPDKINPKEEEYWAFIANNYELWFFHENKWISNYGNTKFPGYSSIIGVKEDFKERSNIVRKLRTKNLNTVTLSELPVDSQNEIMENLTKDMSSKANKSSRSTQKPSISAKSGKEKKSGCFIATAVYGSHSNEVVVLKSFRDNTLKNYFLGRLFIHFYYNISPYFVKTIESHHFISMFLRRILDKLIKKIN